MYNFKVLFEDDSEFNGVCNDFVNSLGRRTQGEQIGELFNSLTLTIYNNDNTTVDVYNNLFNSPIRSISIVSSDDDDEINQTMTFTGYQLNRVDRRFNGTQDAVIILLNK